MWEIIISVHLITTVINFSFKFIHIIKQSSRKGFFNVICQKTVIMGSSALSKLNLSLIQGRIMRKISIAFSHCSAQNEPLFLIENLFLTYICKWKLIDHFATKAMRLTATPLSPYTLIGMLKCSSSIFENYQIKVKQIKEPN